MKKFSFYTFGVLSLASIGLVGCESAVVEEDVAPAKKAPKIERVTVVANPSAAATKLAIAEGWDLSWEEGELIAGYSVDSESEMYYGYDSYWGYDPYGDDFSDLYPFEASGVSADGNSASFSGDKVEDCELRLVYPYVENKKASYFGFEYKIELASVSVDPAAEAYAAAKANMYMVSHDVDVADGEGFEMEHLTSFVEWKLSSAGDEEYAVSSIELAPSAGSSVEIPVEAKLNLSKEFGASGFYSEKVHDKYVVDFVSPLSVSGTCDVYTSILPFTFVADQSIDVVVYYSVDGAEYYQTIVKSNGSGADIVFDAGEYNGISCALDKSKAVAIAAAEVSASVSDIEINKAKLSVVSSNAVEVGYICEESSEFDDVEVDADYVVDECGWGDSAVPSAEGDSSFDLTYLFPGKEYIVYVYAKNASGATVITEAVKFSTTSLPAMSVVEDEVTTTSVTFTPGYQDSYFTTIAYDCFLAEMSGNHSASMIIGDSSSKKIFNNSKDPITIDGLEPGTEYIVRLVGSKKDGSTYYTSADLAFTTKELAGVAALADAQVFDQVSFDPSAYNRSTLVFANADYQVSFDFKYSAHYVPSIPVGDFDLFMGSIKDLSNGSVIDCIEDSNIRISYADGKYSFSGKMLTNKISDPAKETDNKYLDFSCSDAVVSVPVKIVEQDALCIPAKKAYSFFIPEGQYASEFGLYLVLDNLLDPSMDSTSVSAAVEGSYIQRYQAGEGNVLVEGQCIYDIVSLSFDVAYDADKGTYTLSNGVGSTADGSFVVETVLSVDPANLAPSEVSVALTKVVDASGVVTKTDNEYYGAGYYDYASEYTLSFASDIISNLVLLLKSGLSSDPGTSYIPSLSFADGEGSWSTIDDVEISCTLEDGSDPLVIKNSEVVSIVKSGDSYDISIEFESTSNNTTYTATYRGAIEVYNCELIDKTGWY